VLEIGEAEEERADEMLWSCCRCLTTIRGLMRIRVRRLTVTELRREALQFTEGCQERAAINLQVTRFCSSCDGWEEEGLSLHEGGRRLMMGRRPLRKDWAATATGVAEMAEAIRDGRMGMIAPVKLTP
jgi:hypothetical protein